LELNGFQHEVAITIQRKEKFDIEVLGKRIMKVEELVCKKTGVLNKWFYLYKDTDMKHIGKIRIVTLLTSKEVVD
jgi:hypothetical protein